MIDFATIEFACWSATIGMVITRPIKAKGEIGLEIPDFRPVRNSGGKAVPSGTRPP